MKTELNKKPTHRMRDYVLYLAMSFAVVAAIFAIGYSRVDLDKAKKWAFALFYTSFVFGFVIEQSRMLWKLRSFWLLTGLLLLLHCIALAMILATTQHMRAISWIPGFVETVVLARSIPWLLRRSATAQ